jgi:anti-sigma regulatory factor (Ser/Thr protein kinase)
VGRLASDTRCQLETAAKAGRLVVPTRSLPARFDIPYRFAPAPPSSVGPVLDTYSALHVAATLDKAVDQLIIRAASNDQPAMESSRLRQSAGTAEIRNHLLASHGDGMPGSIYPPDRHGRSQDRNAATARASMRIQLPEGLTAPRQARAAVRQALSDWAMTALSDDAELLTSELVANAAEHASGPIALAIYTHRLPSGRAAITCEVSDSSPRPSGARASRPGQRTGPRPNHRRSDCLGQRHHLPARRQNDLLHPDRPGRRRPTATRT